MNPLSVVQWAGSLALVLGLIFLAAYAAKRFLPSHLGMWRSEPLIRVLSRVRLGTRQEVAVLDVCGTCLVVGVTATHITLLVRLEDGVLPSELSRKAGDARDQGAQIVD